jgi:CheY-like chemotaxis protein
VTLQKLILYADDDMDDRALVEQACIQTNAQLQVKFVENGKGVLQYLKDEARGQLPSMVVLDLNMPQMDGRQTLQHIKSSIEFQHIPVAVITTSDNRIDREVCVRLGASLYFIKPDTLQGWQALVRQLEAFIS